MSLFDDWNSLRNRPFPREIAGAEIDGVCITSVDTFAAGCLTTYFERSALDDERIAILEACVRDLHRVLPLLPSGASEYFAELAGLCLSVLRAVDRRN